MTNEEAIKQLLEIQREAEYNLRHTYEAESISLYNADIEALDKAIDALHSPWISVDAQLPEREGVYLVCMEGGSAVTYPYSFDFMKFPKIFTHWMPIPELPKGENE